MATYAPKLPLKIDNNGIESYEVSEVEDLAKQNLVMILLTSPGERIMDAAFGVGLRDYLFELPTPTLAQKLKAESRRQIKLYGPPITINSIDIAFDTVNAANTGGNILYFRMSYIVNATQVKDFLELQLQG